MIRNPLLKRRKIVVLGVWSGDKAKSNIIVKRLVVGMVAAYNGGIS